MRTKCTCGDHRDQLLAWYNSNLQTLQLSLGSVFSGWEHSAHKTSTTAPRNHAYRGKTQARAALATVLPALRWLSRRLQSSEDDTIYTEALSTMSVSVNGGCLCGALRYTSTPYKVRSVGLAVWPFPPDPVSSPFLWCRRKPQTIATVVSARRRTVPQSSCSPGCPRRTSSLPRASLSGMPAPTKGRGCSVGKATTRCSPSADKIYKMRAQATVPC